MIPEKIKKLQEKSKLVKNLNKLIEFWFNQREVGELLWVHKNKVNSMLNEWVDYPISLHLSEQYNEIIDKKIKELSNL